MLTDVEDPSHDTHKSQPSPGLAALLGGFVAIRRTASLALNRGLDDEQIARSPGEWRHLTNEVNTRSTQGQLTMGS